MELLELTGGGVSLEFQESDFPAVMAALRLLADGAGILRTKYATLDALTVAGHDLTLLYDWEEPCLIATNEGGCALLRDAKAIVEAGESRAG